MSLFVYVALFVSFLFCLLLLFFLIAVPVKAAVVGLEPFRLFCVLSLKAVITDGCTVSW